MATALGAFQFDNLVRSRIPFLFINLGVETAAEYPHIYKTFLETNSLKLAEKDLVSASAEEIISAVTAMKYPQSSAIVIIDEKAARAEELAEAFDKAGFTNAFYLRGGWMQLVQEKSAGF